MTFTQVVDDYSPIYQGDTLQPLSVQFAEYNSAGQLQAYSLTGLTISIKFVNEAGTVIAGTGTWTIDDAANGLAHYTYASADIATPGLWTLYIKLTNSTSGAFVHGVAKQLEVLSTP